MTLAVRTYVAAVLCAAAVVVAVAGAIGGTDVDLAMTAGFAAAFLLVQLLPVPFPRGSQLELVRVEEALVVPLLLVLAPLDALLAVAVGILAGHLVQRADLTKALFNSAQLVVSVAAALAVTVSLAGPAAGYGALQLLAAAAGLAAMFVVNQLLFAGILRLAASARIVEVLREDLPLKLGMWTANAAIGTLLVLPAVTAPELLLVALLPLAMLHGAWRVHADRAQEEQRLRELGDAVGEFGSDASIDQLARHLADRAREVLGASGAEVRLYQSDRAWWTQAHGDHVERGTHRMAAAHPRVGSDRTTSSVRLVGGDATLGELVVWREREHDARGDGFSRRERTLLEVFGHQAGATIHNAMLAARTAQQQRTIAQVFDNSSEGMLVLDRRGRVRGWNPAMRTISGFEQGTVEAAPISLLSAQLAAISAADGPGSLDAVIATADGERRTVHASYARIEDADVDGEDDSPTWVVVVRDVTREQETERLKDDFVATVSHELRTPLTAIKGFLETMRRDDVELTAAQIRMFLQIMSEQSDRLERLIGDLLDMSAIESGRPLEVEITPVDLGTAVESAVTTFRAARPAATVHVDDPDDLGLIVRADVGRLEQVVVNLLDNALKHAGADQPIEVHMGRDSTGAATVAVTDHGDGIAQADQTRVFERFYVTSDSVTRAGGGAGLGLYICRRLVAAMQGQIAVRSRLGEGATFVVSLPVHASAGGADDRVQIARDG